MYVCMYVCMNACDVCMYVCMYVCVHQRLCLPSCLPLFHVHICIYMHAYQTHLWYTLRILYIHAHASSRATYANIVQYLRKYNICVSRTCINIVLYIYAQYVNMLSCMHAYQTHLWSCTFYLRKYCTYYTSFIHMYAHIYIYTHVYTHTHMHLHSNIHTCIHTYIHT
jgi:hypothetical protein